MRIVRTSPTAWARLSVSMERERSSFQSDWAKLWPWETNKRAPQMALLQRNDNHFFIFNLSAEFASRFDIAHANDLSGYAVFQYFDFHRDAQRTVLHDCVGYFATPYNRPQAD